MHHLFIIIFIIFFCISGCRTNTNQKLVIIKPKAPQKEKLFTVPESNSSGFSSVEEKNLENKDVEDESDY